MNPLPEPQAGASARHAAHYCLEQLRRIQGWEDASDADEEQSNWSVYQRTIEALEGFEQAAAMIPSAPADIVALVDALGEAERDLEFAVPHASDRNFESKRGRREAAREALLSAMQVVLDAHFAGHASPAPAHVPESEGTQVEVDYTNYRGERHLYRLVPTGRMLSGPSKWHPDAPWLIEADVFAKDGVPFDTPNLGRTFDPANIHRWGPSPVRQDTPTEPSPDALRGQIAHFLWESRREIHGNYPDDGALSEQSEMIQDWLGQEADTLIKAFPALASVEPRSDALREARYCLEQLRRIQGWEDASDADEEQSNWSVYQRTIEALEGFEQAAMAPWSGGSEPPFEVMVPEDALRTSAPSSDGSAE